MNAIPFRLSSSCRTGCYSRLMDLRDWVGGGRDDGVGWIEREKGFRDCNEPKSHQKL